MIISEFDQAKFLSEYWQKKPCVIKSFVKNFSDPVDEHELAGLAQEPEIDSRIVSYNKNEWHAAQGPFEDFSDRCVGAWTLLVQGVDRYVDEVDELTNFVNFIPNWRLDDVMISFSNEGAGVGSHTDEYDVFIIQGKGQRRWQVGLPGEYEERIPHPLLKQIDSFEPLIDEVLSCGDVVYIPPKHPHNGVALSDCLNYSIGFRAPTSLEVLTGLIDENKIEPSKASRYADPELSELRASSKLSAAMDKNEIHKIKQSLVDLVNSEHAEQAILQMLSRQSLPFDAELRTDYTEDEVYEALVDEVCLARMTGVKPIYVHPQNSGVFTFYIDGNSFTSEASLADSFEILLNSKELTFGVDIDKELLESPQFLRVIKELVNSSFWVLLE